MGIRLGKVVAVAALALLAPFAGQAQVQTSGGEVAPKNLNQKNVVDQLIVRDSLEVELAQLATTRSQNPAVKELANALATDAGAHLENLRKLAAKAEVGREAAAADPSAAKLAGVLAKLQAIPADNAAEFDRAFVDAQIALHESAAAAFATIQPAATDNDLKQDIEGASPIVQKHLEAAKAVATQLGKPEAKDAAAKRPPVDSTAKAPAAKPPVR
jgi:putative membrane protein